MIVICQLVDTERKVVQASELVEDEVEGDIEIEFCKVKINRLIAMNSLELTVYNYND